MATACFCNITETCIMKWILLLVLTFEFVLVTGDCTAGTQLPDAARRSLSYTSSSTYISDATLASGWYNAIVSNFYYVMTDQRPQLTHCGTYNPIYLKDPMPKLEEDKEVNLTACFMDYDNDCKIRYSIKARLCAGAPQYYLVPTDGQSAYCFEPTNVKAIAEAPTEVIREEIVVTVALFYINTTDAFVPLLDFKCNFEEVQEKPEYLYEVTWYINERAEKTSDRVHYGTIDSTNLNETEILARNYSLGISIKCGVRISATARGNQTRIQYSDSFYVGLKIDSPVVTLNRGQTMTITVRPTVPLGCSKPHKDVQDGIEPCALQIKLFDPSSRNNCTDTQVALLSNQKLCGKVFNGSRRSSNNICLDKHNKNSCGSSSVLNSLPNLTMEVKTTNDLTYKNDETFSLQLKTSEATNHNIWKNQYLDKITVNVNDSGTWKGKKCEAVVDPQMLTFDGKGWTMSELGGAFVLYKSKTLDMQVQIKTFRCSNSANGVCVCAAAIEGGGDIFLIDICETKNINFISCKGDVLNVRMLEGEHYKIFLPTGTYVDVHIRSSSAFLEVYVYSSPSDVSNTEGMCGNFNGIKFDDPTVFVRTNDSLFNNSRHVSNSEFKYTQTVCICQHIKNEDLPSSTPNYSGGFLDEAYCTNKQYATCTETVRLKGEQKTCAIRSKRSLKRHKENILRRMQNTLIEKDVYMVSKREVQDDVTFEEAYTICLNVFSSKKLFSMNNLVPGDSLNSSLEACARDAMIDSTNDDWLQAHFESWADSIVNEFERNTTFTNENPMTVQSFEEQVCPFQCNNNGDCVNGNCVCNEGYDGDSCFVQRSAPLNITDIEGDGKCDLSLGDDCHDCLQFHTENLLSDFKCHIRSIETHIDGTIGTPIDLVKGGGYENIFEGYCCPDVMDEHIRKRSVGQSPFVTEYQISVSNDGINFGSKRSVYVYDSTCQNYVVLPSGDWLFSLKDGTCFVNGKCLRTGERRFGSDCLLCNPERNKFDWTEGCIFPPDEGNEKNNKGDGGSSSVMTYAIAISLTGVIVIGVIAALVIYKYQNNKRSSQRTTYYVARSAASIEHPYDLYFEPAERQFTVDNKPPHLINYEKY